MRRAAHEGLNVRAAEKYKLLQEIEAARLVANLLHDPDNWDVHFKRYQLLKIYIDMVQ